MSESGLATFSNLKLAEMVYYNRKLSLFCTNLPESHYFISMTISRRILDWDSILNNKNSTSFKLYISPGGNPPGVSLTPGIIRNYLAFGVLLIKY